MNNELTMWIMGCLFGIIVGWLFASAYYWNKIRKIRIQQLRDMDEMLEIVRRQSK